MVKARSFILPVCAAIVAMMCRLWSEPLLFGACLVLVAASGIYFGTIV